MKDKDLMTTDYDISQIEEDPRLVQCRKEFLVLLTMIVITSAIIIVICYFIDWGAVTSYTYLFGLPMWLALSAIVSIVGTIACLIYCVKGIEDISLENEE